MTRLDWKVLVWMGCVACSTGGDMMTTDDAMAPNPGLSSTANTTTAAAVRAGTSGSLTTATAGATGAASSVTPSTTSAEAGNSGAAASTVTRNGGAAGSSAAQSSAGMVSSPSSSGAAGASAMSGVAGSLASAAGNSGTVASSSAAGQDGAAGVGDDTSSEGANEVKHPCVANGNEVLFIGDSYSDYATAHESLASLMAALAVQDGALQAGDQYRNRAVAGTTLAAEPAAIQSQWEENKAMKPIKAVVMDGGGNDVLIAHPECEVDGAEMQKNCQDVVAASMGALMKMWPDMKANGVSDVMFFWYPHLQSVGVFNTQGTANTISDYTYPMIVDLAKSVTTDDFHVWVVPTVDIFKDHPEYFYVGDNLHANTEGESKIAAAIWKVMKDNCIGQASSSGCCMP